MRCRPEVPLARISRGGRRPLGIEARCTKRFSGLAVDVDDADCHATTTRARGIGFAQ